MAACEASPTPTNKLEPIYDKKTGKLEVLKYDSDGDGKFDTVSYMDGARIVRIEIDRDEDGKIDRWEYYGPGQKLEKVGFSRANDGIEDASVAFDVRHRGTPDRRLVYGKDGSARLETDETGGGQFIAVNDGKSVGLRSETRGRGSVH
jgi:hypothetical protein